MTGRRGGAAALGAFLLCAALPAPAGAQEEERETGWSNTAELSIVFAAGNAESSTVGARNVLERKWERSTVRLTAGGLRTESTTTSRSAVGTPGDFEVVETSDDELTAENYYARARYEWLASERWFVFGTSGWERNEFAGIDNRFAFAGGFGRVLAEGGGTTFKIDLAGTVTVEDPTSGEGSETFAGLRFGWELARQLTGTTEFTSDLTLDESLNDTEDLRADITNAIAVSISSVLALKTSWQLLWDAQPALVGVPLRAPDGTDTGTQVLAEVDPLDSLLTVALVVKL